MIGLLFFLPALLCGFSLTNQHVSVQPLLEIEKELSLVYFHNPAIAARYETAKPLFKKMVAAEASNGFFGYHASTHQFRIFQDIQRVLYEDYLGFPIPKDFHFMRIPGDPLFDLIAGTKSYYDLFDPAKIALSTRNELVEELVLKPFRRKTGGSLTSQNLSENECKLLFETIKKNLLTKTWPKGTPIAAFKGQINSNSFLKTKYLQKIDTLLSKEDPNYEYKKRMLVSLVEKGISTKKPGTPALHLVPFFQEGVGSKKGSLGQKLQEFMSYDALLSALFDVIGEKKREHLLVLIFPYWDTRPEQQSRVISMNFSLYANHNNPGESTLHVFLGNESIENGERQVSSLLEKLFDEIGLPKEALAPLAKEAFDWLYTRMKTGVIYQFFDSDKTLCNLDQLAYVSEPFGIPIKDISPSDIAKGAISPFRDTQPLQLRLLTTNRGTLNPYTKIRIVRHDLLSQEEQNAFLQFLRTRILALSYNPIKRDQYRQKLKSLWNP